MPSCAAFDRRHALKGIGGCLAGWAFGSIASSRAAPLVEARAASAGPVDSRTLTWLPAWRLRQMMQAREISPLEVTNHFLDRIEQLDQKLNAFRVVDYVGAREQARRAEKAFLAREALGALHGIPVALKEHIAVRGLPSWSIATDVTAPAQRDSIQAERLRAAGAILLGLTVANTTPGTPHSYVGKQRARNPWDISRTPGASSAGSAAAVAAGLIPLTIGSDAGGSTRIPAAFCGLVGLHPTRGRVPTFEVDFPGQFLGITTGPIARSTRDAAVALQAMAGPDGRDMLSLQDDPPMYEELLDRPLEGLHLAWTDDFGFAAKYAVPGTSEVIETIRRAAFSLRATGASVEKIEQVWEHAGLKESPQQIDAVERNWRHCRSVLAHYDVLMSPTIQFIAPTFAEWDSAFANNPTYLDSCDADLLMLNQIGFPAVSVPASFVNGMPVALQIIGRPNSEPRLLQVANALLKIQIGSGSAR